MLVKCKGFTKITQSRKEHRALCHPCIAGEETDTGKKPPGTQALVEDQTPFLGSLFYSYFFGNQTT